MPQRGDADGYTAIKLVAANTGNWPRLARH